MNIDFKAKIIQQLQTQLQHKHAQSNQHDDQQLLAQLMVALILKQLESALQGGGSKGNGPDAAGGAGGSNGVGGAGGAGGPQQADGAHGGPGITGVLTQVLAVLKLLDAA